MMVPTLTTSLPKPPTLGVGLNVAVFGADAKLLPPDPYPRIPTQWIRLFCDVVNGPTSAQIATQIIAARAAGKKVVMTPGVWTGKDPDVLIKWWAGILKLVKPDVIDMIAEPHNNWDDEDFRQNKQPAIYAKIRALAPQTTIMLSPGGFAGTQMFEDYEQGGGGQAKLGGPMWLPADKSNVLIGAHDYFFSPGTLDNAFNLDGVKRWQDKYGVKVVVGEYDGSGGGTQKVTWDTYLRVVAAKAALYAERGFPSALWMHKQMLDADWNIRSDLLFASQRATYTPPLDPTIVTGSGAAGSSPITIPAAVAVSTT